LEECVTSKWIISLVTVGALTGSILTLPASADDAVVKHMTDADLLAILAAPRTTPPATQLTQHATYVIQLFQRKQSGGVEQHMDWNEYFIVQDGDATFNYGGASVNAMETRRGERMGDSIAGGSTIQLHKGDVVMVPAGTPHQFVLVPGATIRYLDFKGHKD
jgi:mannose-6-phosphate isomerase-like protein (cupin superfamily)